MTITVTITEPERARPRPTLVLPLVMTLAALCGVPSAAADTITLTRPVIATCVTDPSAVFTVQDGELHPVRGQFMIFPPGSAALRPQVQLPSDGQPGELLKAYVQSAEPLDSVSLALGTPGKTPVSRAVGFQDTESQDLWAALLGIPTWGVPGSYSLTLTVSAGGRTFLQVVPFTVEKRAFVFERLRLDADLTKLITSSDAQKARETRILIQVLTTPHPDAVFETGTLLTPLPGARHTSGYGDRRELDFTDGTRSDTVHLGVDLASPQGTPVPASGRGRVVFAGPRILTGNTVIVEHLPGLFSVYYHLSAIGVGVGDMVEKGEVIGKVGMTGFATGPHLHWEIEDMGVAVDPDEAAQSPLLDKPGDFPDIGSASSTEGR